MSEKQIHHVRIAGIDLPLASEESKEYVQSLASQLDHTLEDISRGGRGCSKIEAAILCCLDLWDEKIHNVDILKLQQAQIAQQLEEISSLKASLADTVADNEALRQELKQKEKKA